MKQSAGDDVTKGRSTGNAEQERKQEAAQANCAEHPKRVERRQGRRGRSAVPPELVRRRTEMRVRKLDTITVSKSEPTFAEESHARPPPFWWFNRRGGPPRAFYIAHLGG